MSKAWTDRADRDLFFAILTRKQLGVISGAEWAVIGRDMRARGYGFTNEGCRQHFQGLRRAQSREEGAAAGGSDGGPAQGSAEDPAQDPAQNPITRRPGKRTQAGQAMQAMQAGSSSGTTGNGTGASGADGLSSPSRPRPSGQLGVAVPDSLALLVQPHEMQPRQETGGRRASFGSLEGNGEGEDRVPQQGGVAGEEASEEDRRKRRKLGDDDDDNDYAKDDDDNNDRNQPIDGRDSSNTRPSFAYETV